MTNPGLEGVVVADTQISEVDGERGRLVIAGADVEQLARTATFEEAAVRVLSAGAGARVEVPRERLGAARAEAWELLPRLGDALDHADGMDALRTALAHIRTAAGARAGSWRRRARPRARARAAGWRAGAPPPRARPRADRAPGTRGGPSP